MIFDSTTRITQAGRIFNGETHMSCVAVCGYIVKPTREFEPVYILFVSYIYPILYIPAHFL